MKLKICIITGSRAEFGIIRGLIKSINDDKSCDLKMIFTGSHLSRKFGYTFKDAKYLNQNIIRKVNILNKQKITINDVISKTISKIDKSLKLINPDVVLLVGDRYEIFASSISCYTREIPIVHFHGGEKTFFSLDENFRHSITKFSHLHFVSTQSYKKRVIQLGENPKNIHVSGSLSLKNFNKNTFKSKLSLEKKFKFKFNEKNILATLHPEALSKKDNLSKINIILDTLKNIKNSSIIFTMPGADPNNEIIYNEVNSFVKKNTNFYLVKSFGTDYYFSMLNNVDFMIGNSSSGIIEMPSFNKPTINVGHRQLGREMAKSIFNVNYSKKNILKIINKIYSKKSKKFKVKNPYYNNMTYHQILKIIKKFGYKKNFYKNFYDI